MPSPTSMLRLAALLLCAHLAPPLSAAPDLFGGFADGWRNHWREEKFFTKPTRYTVVTDDGQRVLHATSEASHAGLYRAVTVAAPTEARLSWRWKIRSPLAGRPSERTRAGDDYAARVFVVFEPSVLPLRTRALNYVWSATEPVGAVFPSPYTSNVAMFVIRSGSAEAGRWHAESRDVLADYRQFFGVAPAQISAVAILVDTDNTRSSAEAWFSSLMLDTTPTRLPAP